LEPLLEILDTASNRQPKQYLDYLLLFYTLWYIEHKQVFQKLTPLLGLIKLKKTLLYKIDQLDISCTGASYALVFPLFPEKATGAASDGCRPPIPPPKTVFKKTKPGFAISKTRLFKSLSTTPPSEKVAKS
jgi:hypothetical protein